MEPAIVLIAAAAPLAFIHTMIGIDHYLPFVVLGKSNEWTVKKTLSVTAMCGIGHVLSSVLLGFAGIALSIGVSDLIDIEDIRGEIAMWFLIAFGLAYMAYGIRKAIKNAPHTHRLPDGHTITHAHINAGEGHEHKQGKRSSNTIWGLFILFILGPCEPLIPLIMYPAATENIFALVTVTLAFLLCTVATMLVMTYIGLKGLRMVRINRLERYTHALAGFAVLVCGLAIMIFDI